MDLDFRGIRIYCIIGFVLIFTLSLCALLLLTLRFDWVGFLMLHGKKKSVILHSPIEAHWECRSNWLGGNGERMESKEHQAWNERIHTLRSNFELFGMLAFITMVVISFSQIPSPSVSTAESDSSYCC
ncbi:hypothetical protein HS088_TW16G00343 [Tripterygium wilfordii]|uniref:Uncharacterized protein n=1 Tax=Tripterygium wilfordii TaxID=458696 RepID=A0A7J7CIL5_TRIWF|nr:hypothetical protein HS088_TW16G00343 [Tripterygium wilfordii]